MKDNFKVVDNFISDKQVKSFNYYEYDPKKVQFQLINIIVYDIELLTHYILQLKGEPKKTKNKIVLYNIYLLAKKGSGFDS